MSHVTGWAISFRRFWNAFGSSTAGANTPSVVARDDLPASAEHSRPSRQKAPRTIRQQLLVRVNLILGLLLTVALTLDYQRALTHRIAERRIALEEEAKTIAAAIPELSHHGPTTIQTFLDNVCGSLSEAESPGHHVAVLWNETIFQPTVHGHSSAGFYEAIRNSAHAPDGRSRFAERELVAASRPMSEGVVYVSSDVTGIRNLVVIENLSRFLSLLLAGTIAAGVVNVVLYRGLARPLERLVGTVGQIAQGQLGLQAGRFRTVELATLAGAINEMSQALAANQRERSQQLEKARRLQDHLLQEWPAVPDLKIARLFHPATEVTGDFTDLAIGPDGTVVLCIADVSGHGVPAAMGAAMLKTLFLSAVADTSDPADVLQRLNAGFGAVIPPGDFVTMFVVRWNAARRVAEYASAGHEPPWLCRSDGECVPLAATGLPLGVCADGQWPSETIPIRGGDRLLLFTDGATECMSPIGELFGRDRLALILRGNSSSPVGEVVSAVERELQAHRQNPQPKDDLTMVLIEFRGSDL